MISNVRVSKRISISLTKKAKELSARKELALSENSSLRFRFVTKIFPLFDSSYGQSYYP